MIGTPACSLPFSTINEPALKRILFASPETRHRINHLGVELFDGAEVGSAPERIKAAGLQHRFREDAVCRRARQNKVWAHEPGGLQWERCRAVDDVEYEKALQREDDTCRAQGHSWLPMRPGVAPDARALHAGEGAVGVPQPLLVYRVGFPGFDIAIWC